MARIRTDQESEQVSWARVLFYLHVHLFAFIALGWLTHVSVFTLLWTASLVLVGYVGVTLGAHRLWAHHVFSAGAAVRTALTLCHLVNAQGSVRSWALRHRRHHRHLGTARDPYDVSRGFLYTHLLSNMRAVSSSEDAEDQAAAADLDADGVVWLTERLHWPLTVLLAVLAVLVPVYAWDESLMGAAYVAGALRLVLSAHGAWLVYSAWHVWGLAPGDRYPADTPLVFVLTRSHWPRYHHAVPWDWRAGELGSYDSGVITALLRVLAALRLVRDMRSLEAAEAREAAHQAATSGRPFHACLDELLQGDRRTLLASALH